MSTFDFFTARTNNTDLDVTKCYTSAPSGNPVLDDVLGRLRTARSDNVVGLFICAIVVSIAFLILWYAVSSVISSLKDWKSHLVDGSIPHEFDPDDEVYVEESNQEDDIPPVPSSAAVAAKMAQLAIEYAGYNDAMKRYSLKRNEGPPDALIDMHILSRGDDDFKYPRKRRDDRVKFRKHFVEYEKVYTGGYVGLKQPTTMVDL